MQQEIHIQYCSSDRVLLVNNKGKIRVLYTPFRVLCIDKIQDIPLNSWVYVEEVLSNHQDQLQFVIFGCPYLHKHFQLPITF